MSARYEFKVGPANRNSDYADPVTVYADTYGEALNKAITFRGFRSGDGKAWLIRIEELPPSPEHGEPNVQPTRTH